MTAILVTRFLGNESNNVCVQTFCQLVQKQQRKEEEEEEKKVIVKLFALQANSVFGISIFVEESLILDKVFLLIANAALYCKGMMFFMVDHKSCLLGQVNLNGQC